MTTPKDFSDQNRPAMVADVIAEVQAYLEKEAAKEEPRGKSKISSWRIEARIDIMGSESGRRPSWTGRD